LKSLSFLRLEKQNEGFVNRRLERILIIIAKPLSIEYTFRDGYGRNLLVDAIGTKSISKLIKSGRLYSLKDWLEGDGQKSNLSVPAWISLLEESIETGFHSMVELLLNARAWSAEELCDPLNRSLWNMRLDLTELLLTARASVAKVDFSDVCRTMNIELMKRFLRGGVDPSRQNGFACALDRHKAKPLLGFYRAMRLEFPALDAQAALALRVTVSEKNVRWAALLRWAGADPLRPVPWDLSGAWDDPDNQTTAASVACWRGSQEIMKVLRIQPTPDEAIKLLEDTASAAAPELMRFILSFIGRDRINDPEQLTSRALEQLVRWEYRHYGWESGTQAEEEKRRLECIELLLDAGAQWRPNEDELRYFRRGLSRNSARYVVQVVRLLLYTPGVCEIRHVWELCRTDKIRTLIRSADVPLWDELATLSEAYATGGSVNME
jgi:hypothetical protein